LPKRENAGPVKLQELGLQLRRHLSDFIEEYRAPVAKLELSGLG